MHHCNALAGMKGGLSDCVSVSCKPNIHVSFFLNQNASSDFHCNETGHSASIVLARPHCTSHSESGDTAHLRTRGNPYFSGCHLESR
jgi:hypothetical protein